MTADPIAHIPDRQQLVEHAARRATEHPNLSILALIDEYELTVGEACAALRRAHEMRVGRGAFI